MDKNTNLTNPVGTAITRVGCLMFGCDFGRRTDLPWAITFPGPNPMAPHGSPGVTLVDCRMRAP